MNRVYAQEFINIPDHEPALFLAGPTPRHRPKPTFLGRAWDWINGVPVATSWRPEALEHLEALDFRGTVFIPEIRTTSTMLPFLYSDQVDWEHQALERANQIVFWVPRELRCMPAFTTNVEFGMWYKSGKVVLGYPTGTKKMKYLHYLAEQVRIPIRHTLKQTLLQAIGRIPIQDPFNPPRKVDTLSDK